MDPPCQIRQKMSRHEICSECGFDSRILSIEDGQESIDTLSTRWKRTVGSIDQPLIAQRPQPHRWSVAEYTVHIMKILRGVDHALARIFLEDNPKIEDSQSQPSPVQSSQSADELLNDLAQVAAHLVERARTATDTDWSRTGISPRGFEVNARWIFFHGVHEARHHLKDVEVNLRMMNKLFM